MFISKSLSLLLFSTAEAQARSVGVPITSTSTPIEGTCRRVVESIQTFVRDGVVHHAASRALLALIVSTVEPARGSDELSSTQYQDTNSIAHCVGAVGGATALSRVLATSPNNYEVQLPAVLAIAELLERCGGGADRDVDEDRPVLLEIVFAAGCELLCKSAKTFPWDRDLQLGCLRAIAALYRGAGLVAGKRLVDAGVCEQVRRSGRRVLTRNKILQTF